MKKLEMRILEYYGVDGISHAIEVDDEENPYHEGSNFVRWAERFKASAYQCVKD